MIEKRGGKYRVTIYDNADPISGIRPRKTGTFDRHRDAKAAEAKWIQDRDAGIPLVASKRPYGEYLDYWLANVAAHNVGSMTTYADYDHLSTKHIKPKLGQIPLAKLLPSHIQTFQSEQLTSGRLDGKGGLSTSRVRTMRTILKQSLDHAVSLRLIPSNPVDRIKPPKQKVLPQYVWSEDLVATFLAAVDSDPLAALWHVAISTGLRRAELVGLRWEDVDLEHGTIRVVQTYVQVPGGARKKPPKSAAGSRVVAIGPVCAAKLYAHYTAQEMHKQAFARVWQGGAHGLVFCAVDGKPMHPATVTHKYADLLKAAGIPHMKLHNLRRIAASYANVASHGDLRTVSDRLGHSRVEMTQNVYVSGLAERQRTVASGVEELLYKPEKEEG